METFVLSCFDISARPRSLRASFDFEIKFFAEYYFGPTLRYSGQLYY